MISSTIVVLLWMLLGTAATLTLTLITTRAITLITTIPVPFFAGDARGQGGLVIVRKMFSRR